MEKVIYINSPLEMIEFGKKLGQNLKPNMLIALDGDLGAGKTTFTKGIAKALGVERIVNSPTFVIMKIYEGSLTLYHLDVYRTNDSEFELTEYFEAGGVCVIEWADNIASLLPESYLHINICDLGDEKRKVILKWQDHSYDKVVGL